MLPKVDRRRSITTSAPKNYCSCSSDLDRSRDEIFQVNASVDASASESQSTTAMFQRECCAPSSHQPQPPPPSDVEVDDDENDEGASSSCSSSNDGTKWTNIGGALLTLTGFRQCSSEAIRYLVEEERLHPDDPVVVGLREHLRRREQCLGLTTVLDNLIASFDDELDDYSDGDGDDRESMDSDESLMVDVDRVEPNVTDKWVIRTSGCHSANRIEHFLPETASTDDHQRPPDSPTPSI